MPTASLTRLAILVVCALVPLVSNAGPDVEDARDDRQSWAQQTPAAESHRAQPPSANALAAPAFSLRVSQERTRNAGATESHKIRNSRLHSGACGSVRGQLTYTRDLRCFNRGTCSGVTAALPPPL